MRTGTRCVVANGKCWPSLQQFQADQLHQAFQVGPVAGGEREQLEPKCHKTRASLKYSFDFWKSSSWCSIFFLVCQQFCSQNAETGTELSQHKEKFWVSGLLCGWCLSHTVGWMLFPLSQSVCLFVCLCMCVCVHACMPVYCVLRRTQYPVKACLR